MNLRRILRDGIAEWRHRKKPPPPRKRHKPDYFRNMERLARLNMARKVLLHSDANTPLAATLCVHPEFGVHLAVVSERGWKYELYEYERVEGYVNPETVPLGGAAWAARYLDPTGTMWTPFADLDAFLAFTSVHTF